MPSSYQRLFAKYLAVREESERLRNFIDQLDRCSDKETFDGRLWNLQSQLKLGSLGHGTIVNMEKSKRKFVKASPVSDCGKENKK